MSQVETVAPARRGFEADAGRYFAGRVLVAGAGMLTIPIFTRSLGVAAYGALSILTALAAWTPAFLAGWLQQAVLRYHQAYCSGEHASAYLGTVRWATVPLAVLSGALCLLIVALMGFGTALECALAAAVAAAAAWNIVLSALAQAEQRSSLVVRADAVRVLITPGLYLIAMASGARPTLALALASFAAAYIASNLLLHTGFAQTSISVGRRREALSRLGRFGLPMGLWLALSLGQGLVGRLVIEKLGNRQELGLYAAGVDLLTKVGTVLLMPITYALHAHVMAAWSDGRRREATAAIRSGYRYQWAIGGVLVAGVWVFSAPLTRILDLGAAALHGKAGLTLVTISVGTVLANLALVAHKGLEIAERTRLLVLLMVGALGINTAVTVVLAPRYGALGAAAGFAAGIGVYLMTANALSTAYLRKEAA